MSIYKTQEPEEILVAYVPIKFSFLFSLIIEKDCNKIDDEVRGGRQLENGLEVPATYFVCGRNRKLVKIFFDEAKKQHRGMAAHMNRKRSDVKTYLE